MKYTVINEGWLDGNYRTKGEILEMLAEQAKWLLRAGSIAPCEPAKPEPAPPAPDAKVADKPKRSKDVD